MNQRRLLPVIITIVVVLLLLLYMGNNIFIILKPGERGILFKRLTSGLDKETIYRPGLNIVAPWNEMFIYDVRENKVEEQMGVLDKNGLSIKIDVSVRFHPIYDRIGYLHETFGEDYVNRLVVPEVRSTVRRVIGEYTAEEIYSTKRSEVETKIIEETDRTLKSENNNIQMKALLIRNIVLPDKIKAAIENKLTAQQEALAMEYVKNKEKEEAERKRIAAQGEADANEIINNSLTAALLKMRGIEATTKLANSPNSKVVVIGSGDDGLPLILGNN